MKIYYKNIKYLICLCLFFGLFFDCNIGVIKISAGSSIKSNYNKDKKSGQFVSIDFNNVDINVFIKFISEITGKNFVVDRRVKGKVTIISPTKISVDQTYKVFESVLEVHGYTTVPTGKVIKIVPFSDARMKNVETLLKQEKFAPEDKVVTQVIFLKYALPRDIKRLFAPFISKNGVIMSYSPTNTIIVTDVYSNIKRLLKIIKAIDVEGVGQAISIIPLKYGDARKLENLLSYIFRPARRVKNSVTSKTVRFVADERTNTIVMHASEVDTQRIKKLIKSLDQEVPKGKEKIHVFYLEYATSEELAKVLQAMSSSKTSRAKGPSRVPLVSEKVVITPDKATNSLIIMADKDDYIVLEEIIKKLDIPRSMVYIECLIMEVNISKNFNIGATWSALGTTRVDGSDGVFGGSFNNSTSTTALALENAPLLPLSNAQDFAVGIIGKVIKFDMGGKEQEVVGLNAMAKALKINQDVHILSLPQILTTNNEKAKIVVGKNIPYQTKSGFEGDSTYNSYEYKDVGKTLEITPQISKDRMVRLKISLKVETLDAVTTGGQGTDGSVRPTTLKRTVDTSVIVKDNNTVVIGGLIGEDLSKTARKIPCLGSIPVLGWLFKSFARGRSKTNLYVFITPHVVRHPSEAEEIYKKKKSHIDKITGESEDSETIKMYREWKKQSEVMQID